jgi:hypothetical protein
MMMSDTLKAINEMEELNPKTTAGQVKIKYDGYMGSRDYPDYRVMLSMEDRQPIALLAHHHFHAAGSARNKKERGDICTFHGSQSHHESDDDKDGGRSYPGKVRTSRSWSTENKTAHDDAKLFVLLWNHRKELLRLAKIGLKAEQAVKA